MGVAVLVGTRKGLFVLTSDETRRDWTVEGPHLTGFEVFHATRDPRDGTVHAATNNWVYGATAHRSGDQGETWERAEQIGTEIRLVAAVSGGPPPAPAPRRPRQPPPPARPRPPATARARPG